MNSPRESALANQDVLDRAISPNSPQVCAIILTFNRLSSLRVCLATLEKQTRRPDRVLVVDNHGSDGTCEFLESEAPNNPTVSILRTSENLGSAGGFAEGMLWGVENGYDYLWIMDDDCCPEPSCLDVQLGEMDGARSKIVFPMCLDQSDQTANYPAWRGVLIPREVVLIAGVPNRDLFFSKEDTEYLQWRLPQIHKVEVSRTCSAIVRYTRFPSRKKPAWKYYYQGRNTVYYRLWVQRPFTVRRIRRLSVTVIKLWLRIVLLEDQKPKKFKYFHLGIWHGLRGQLGKTFDPAVL